MSNYRYFVFDSFETGCGSVIGIFITTNNHQDEHIWDVIETCFDYYYVSLIKELNREELREYEHYIPRKVLSIIDEDTVALNLKTNKMVITPGAFCWHSQFMVNYA